MGAAVTRGDVWVRNIIPKHMDSLSAKLIEIGVGVEESDDAIRIYSTGKEFKGTNVKTMAYPGFPTDMQPQMAVLLSICKGKSIITENVWEKRYQYTDELRNLGAKINVEGRMAIIEGVDSLVGTSVDATDLRAGAAMIIAGLCARGETTIGEVKYIDRGYEEVEKKLGLIGADIKRVSM